MFDFLFKNRASPATTNSAQAPTQKQQGVDQPAEKSRAKTAELALAASLLGQEDAAVNFILQAEFADARLQALQHIQGEPALAQVGQAMRNIDRRVSKLALDRLAQINYQKTMAMEVQLCSEEGQQLLDRAHLLANHVASWDKKRASLGQYGASLQQLKLSLEERLQRQLDLQRQVLQLETSLRQLHTLPVVVANESMAEILRQFDHIAADPSVASLPKNQLEQLRNDITNVQEELSQMEQVEQFIARRNDALLAWVGVVALDRRNAKTQWEALACSTLTASEAQRQILLRQDQDFATLIAARHGVSQQPSRQPELVCVELKPVFDLDEALHALEQALEHGSLQQALDLDRSLRQSEFQITAEIAARLAALRSELSRLLDWAKWGGNVSREELIKYADGLPGNGLSPVEIAKQVGGLRARWKELDRTSGTAAQALWERFDAACSAAYRVADEFFRQQAKLRADNLRLAQAQLAELDRAIATIPEQILDWRSYQGAVVSAKQAWSKLGAIDRKIKLRLDAEFAEKMAALNSPLEAAIADVMSARQRIISVVSEINPVSRDAVDRVKQAQQMWQETCAGIHLNRKDEQNLWKQFRSACDAIFSQRKHSLEQQKLVRRAAQQAKEDYCQRLEGLRDGSAAEISSALQSAKREWRTLSEQAAGLDARYEAAIHQLENRHAQNLRLDRKNGLANLRAKIDLCRQIEASRRQTQDGSPEQILERNQAWQRRWDELSSEKFAILTAELSKLLSQRFSLAMKGPSSSAATDEEANQVEFGERLLRIEILRSLVSPGHLAQQRLQLQVKDLQSALKNRHAADDYLGNFNALCALPVALDSQSEARFQAILDDAVNA